MRYLSRRTKKVKSEETENLFAYGTLQSQAVQLSLFGRRLDGKPDALPGFRVQRLRIGGRDHRNLAFTGDAFDSVEGMVLTVTKSELEQADTYEPAGYKRTLVQLRSGLNAWVYSPPVAPGDPN